MGIPGDLFVTAEKYLGTRTTKAIVWFAVVLFAVVGFREIWKAGGEVWGEISGISGETQLGPTAIRIIIALILVYLAHRIVVVPFERRIERRISSFQQDIKVRIQGIADGVTRTEGKLTAIAQRLDTLEILAGRKQSGY